MGGSLGLALRAHGTARVTGYARRPETRRLALDGGCVDGCADSPANAVRDADIAVFCTPVLTIPGLVRECREAFRPGCVVTDVGSTKAQLEHEVGGVLAGSQTAFVGSHPMAGSEKTGIEAARADLYQGAVVAVTSSGSETPAVDSVCRMWGEVGGRVVKISAAEHDAIVARTSHLPHLLAALLVTVAGRTQPESAGTFCGPGFRDTTRIAAGSPEMWHDIVKTNRDALIAEILALGDELDRLKAMLDRGDYEAVKDLLERARVMRETLLG